MHIALNLDVEVQDGTLVLTDRTGQTITFSKAQSVQQQVSMITLGDLCGLPKRQLAAGFGFKTRTSYDDSRKAVLQGSLADLFPKRRDPRPSISMRSRRCSHCVCWRSTWSTTSGMISERPIRRRRQR
jgi:hypothetical protein